jgi:Chalcone isomerase-like
MRLHLKHALAAAAGALMLALANPAAAVEVAGVKLDDTAKVGGKELKLNGAGVRVRAVFKVYAMGLYLQDRKKTTADVLAIDGPRRVTLVMLRDVSGDDFGQAFMTGLNANTDKAEKAKLIGQMTQLGETFANTPGGLKKGDLVTLDWVPGTGIVIELNKKSITEPMKEQAFYNALLKIWLGDKPADAALKPALLGEPPEKQASAQG